MYAIDMRGLLQGMELVSWGGAYTASQQKAYHDPYVAANPNVKIINDDSAAEGLAKLRAQVESGKVTWDVVDMTAADAILACDEGLIEAIDPDTWLAPAPDGTPASKDFFAGTLTIGETDCFIPQIVYSTTFGYRTDAFKGRQPSTIADVFDLKTFPGKRSLEKKPINNLEWALIADGVPGKDVYKVLNTSEGARGRCFLESEKRSARPIRAVATLLVCVSILLLTTLELLRRRSERLRGIRAMTRSE